MDEVRTVTWIGFDIEYNNEIIKMVAHPYDIMTNRIMFGQYAATPKFEELEVLEYIKSKFKGGIALDIGACIGNHSIFFSKFIFDKVFAFEANLKNLMLLMENKKNNNISDDKLIINYTALSDGNYNYTCQETKSNMGGTKIIEGDGDGKLMTKRLDEFDLPKINFIKIDVEGHELKVLKGAVNLIKKDFPDILVECFSMDNKTPKIFYSNCMEVDPFMKELNYRMIGSFLDYGLFYYMHI